MDKTAIILTGAAIRAKRGEQTAIAALKFFHGFSTDFGAEFCLCMPFRAEWNKTASQKFREFAGFYGGRGMD